MLTALAVLAGVLVGQGLIELARGHFARRRQEREDAIRACAERQADEAKGRAQSVATAYIQGAIAVLGAAHLAAYPNQAEACAKLLHGIGIRPGHPLVVVAIPDGRAYQAVVRKAEVEWDERAEGCALSWRVEAEEITQRG